MLFYQTIDGMGQTPDHYAYCNQLFREYSTWRVKNWYQLKDDNVVSIVLKFKFVIHLLFEAIWRKRFWKPSNYTHITYIKIRHEPNVNYDHDHIYYVFLLLQMQSNKKITNRKMVIGWNAYLQGQGKFNWKLYLFVSYQLFQCLFKRS